MHELLQRIYRLKVTLLAIITALVGIGLMFFSDWLTSEGLFSSIPIRVLNDIGASLLVAGLIGIALDFIDGKDRDQREDERIRRLLVESAPAFRDAVVEGFAVNGADLERVATPELLDSIATNVLALRLGDRAFAEEIYADVRDQAIRAPERWYDVDVKIRLAPAGARDAKGVPRFDVTVQWEYTVTPSHLVQRFACVSDRDEFHELVTDVPATATWFMTPRPGFHANERDAFELLQYMVDGEPKSIRRSARKTGQTYSVNIGDEAVRGAKPVRISHIYKTITPQSGHRLFFEIAQPTRGLSLELDYSNTDISHLSVTDLVASTQKTRISRLPKEVAAKVISVDLPGWLLPKAGFAFVWTLASEEQPSLPAPETDSPGTQKAAA